MVAVVLQHQSRFGDSGWHAEGDDIGWSGASANGSDWGGDVHLHWHGLDANGNRLRIESFLPAAGVAVLGVEVVEELEKEQDMKILVNVGVESPWVVAGPGVWRQIPSGYADKAIEVFGDPVRVSNVAYDLARKICLNESFG